MSSESPYFSIITPTFNRAKYIVTAIESVLAQSFTNFELIIVDDGSTDETASLIAPFICADKRVSYIHQENKGRSVARNVGIDIAKGKYVCFLDSDDLWNEEHLLNYYEAISNEKKPAYYFGGLTWWFEAEQRKQIVAYRPRTEFFSDVEFVIANQFAPDCVCIHHSILEQNQFNAKLFINEDLELWARIAAENPVIEIISNTALLRVHPGNTSTSTQDPISPTINVFNLLLANKNIRAKLSNQFVKDRKRSLHEQMVRYLATSEYRWRFVFKSLHFVVKYPDQPGNKAKAVSILYALPGGGILKRLIQDSKASN